MTGSQQAVLDILQKYGSAGGACARTFAKHDIYRFSPRIFELRHDYGYTIIMHKCVRHEHRHYVPAYQILRYP